jgi:hypothetical protein
VPDPSFLLPLIFQSAIIPFVIALVLSLALHRRVRSGAAVFALVAAFLASYFATLHAQWSLVPHQALDWTPWIALFGAAAAKAVQRISGVIACLLARAAVTVVAVSLVVWPAQQSLGSARAAAIIGGAGLAITVAWSYLAAAAATRPTPPILLMIVAGGAGMSLMFDSSQAIGQLSGALASALAAIVAINIPRIRAGFGGEAAGFAVVVLGTLLTNAWLYAGLPLAYVALLAGGILADAMVAGASRFSRHNGGLGSYASAVIAVILGAIPVAATVVLAAKAAQEAGGY